MGNRLALYRFAISRKKMPTNLFRIRSQKPDIDRSYRLLRRTSVRTRNPGNRQSIIGMRQFFDSLEHLRDTRFADGTVTLQHLFGDAEPTMFDLVGIGDDTPVEDRRSAGYGGKRRRDTATRATFGERDALAALF